MHIAVSTENDIASHFFVLPFPSDPNKKEQIFSFKILIFWVIYLPSGYKQFFFVDFFYDI